MITHQHGEAFKLMTYECEVCGFHEQIWNSRDGVTPFTVGCRHCIGGSARHVEWHNDTYDPAYKPKPGERIFVDLTKRRAHECAIGFVQFLIDRDMYDPLNPIDIDKKVLAYFGDGRQPDLIAVEG